MPTTRGMGRKRRRDADAQDISTGRRVALVPEHGDRPTVPTGAATYLPLPLAPALRLLERAGPDAALRRARLALGISIVSAAVARVVARVARPHHRVAEIAAHDLAGCDVAVVPV